MPGTDHVSAINIHICRRVVPGHEGGCVPSRSAAYENQALKTEYVKLPALRRFFPRILSDLPKFPPNLLQLKKNPYFLPISLEIFIPFQNFQTLPDSVNTTIPGKTRGNKFEAV